MGKVGKFIIGAVLIGASFLIPGAQWAAVAARGFLLSMGSGLVGQAAFGPGSGEMKDRQRAIEINGANPVDGVPVAYGKPRLGIRFADLRTDPLTSNKDLYVVGVLCHGSQDGSGIGGIDECYFDNVLAINAAGTVQAKWAGKVTITKYLGTTAQTVDPTLAAKFPGQWPTTSKGVGVAYVVIKLTFDDQMFASGLPNMTFNVRGNRVFDPRSSTVGYSTCPPLHLRDYLTAPQYGLGFPTAEIDDTAISAEANYSDALVNIDTGTQKRFEGNGWLDVSLPHDECVRHLLTACRGSLVDQGGAFRLFIPKAGVAASLSLADANFRGGFSLHIPGVDEVPNTVRARFINAAIDYQPDEVTWPRPGAANAYLTADNNYDVTHDIELPFTTDRYMAEQMCMTMLLEGRAGQMLAATFDESALQLQTGDVTAITHTSPAWVAQPFMALGLTLRRAGVVELALKQYDTNAYTLAAQTTLGLPPSAGLPDHSAAPSAPTGLVLLSDATTGFRLPSGELAGGVLVAWTASTAPNLARYEVWGREQGAAAWAAQHPIDRGQTSMVFGPVDSDRPWEFQVYAVSALDVRSIPLGPSPIVPYHGGVDMAGDNVWVNGNGQQGAVGQAATGWPNTAGNPFLVASDKARFGDRSVKVTNAAAAISRSRQTVAVAAGDVVECAGWINVGPTGMGGTGEGAGIEVYLRDAALVAQPLTLLDKLAPAYKQSGGAAGHFLYVPRTDTSDVFQLVRALVRATVAGTVFADPATGYALGCSGSAWYGGCLLRKVAPTLPGRTYNALTDVGQLRDATQQNDPVNNRAILRGVQYGTATHGQTITFSPAYNSPPQVIDIWGGNTDEPRSKWGVDPNALPGALAPLTTVPQAQDFGAEAVTASSFKVRALLKQSPSGATVTTDAFPAGTLAVQGNTLAVTLSAPPANDNTYNVHVTGTLTANMGTSPDALAQIAITYTVDSNDGSGWVERARRSYTLSDDTNDGLASTLSIDETFALNVPGMAATDQFRVTLLTVTKTLAGGGSASVSLDPVDVKYTTGGGAVQFASKTPDAGQTVFWKAGYYA